MYSLTLFCLLFACVKVVGFINIQACPVGYGKMKESVAVPCPVWVGSG